jgi:hypothetical protein
MPGISRFISARAALLLPLILSACANFEKSEVKLQAVKTVGIISAIGDDFTFTPAGLSVVEGKSQHYSIASWGLDDLVAREVTAALSRRFQVQPLSYSRAAFAVSDPDFSISAVNLANIMHEDRVMSALRKEPPAPAVDAYILILKAASPVSSSHRKVAGIGLVNYTAALGIYTQLHALYEIRVIDGHTLSTIARRRAAPLEQGIVRLAGPARMAEDSLMPSSSDPANNEILHAAVLDLIERSLPVTLRNLNLTD